ncbi:hypothetical protein [Trichothermofontia sp.]
MAIQKYLKTVTLFLSLGLATTLAACGTGAENIGGNEEGGNMATPAVEAAPAAAPNPMSDTNDDDAQNADDDGKNNEEGNQPDDNDNNADDDSGEGDDEGGDRFPAS